MSYTESFYVILGVDPDASQQEIKQAYKKAALRTHPDRALPERKADAERDFKRIAEAYETLSEPASRDRYNCFGTANSPPPMRSNRSNRQPASSSSTSAPNSNNTYFGVSPDKQPFSFQWESSYDSARRAQAQRGNGNRRPFGGVDAFQLFNEMFEREFARPMHHGGGTTTSSDIFDDHPFFANHRKMADTGGFGFGFGFGSPSMGMADVPFGFDSPFTSHGSNTMAATRRGAEGGGGGDFAAGVGGMSSSGPFSNSAMMSSNVSSMRSGGVGGNFQSESRSTRTINGHTETIIRKVDGQGNETVHTITPSGQRIHINGIEEPNHPLLQQSQSTNQPALPGPRPGWLF